MKKTLAVILCTLAAAFTLAPAALADVIPYEPPTPPPDAASPATSSLPVWLLIVAVLIIAVSLIIIVSVRKKAKQK